MAIPADVRQALESFLVSDELALLESRFARFNVFEALGVARKELHHSSFLAYLLNPSESHGLRGLFVQRFLQEVARNASDPAVSVIELDGLEFAQATVQKEFKNIDILLTDRISKIAVVVENKVGTKQHDDQLQRYYETVKAKHPDFRFIGVYLTPDGEESKHDQYVPLSYTTVRKLVIGLLSRETVLLSPVFRSVFKQYADLLGRRFMADLELKELCSDIYKRHKQAIDILLNNRPDSFSIALETIKTLVKKSDFISIEDDNNNAIRFIPKSFDIAPFHSETAWLSDSQQLVYLECKKKNESLVFQAKMDGGSIHERAHVHRFASTHPPFKVDKAVYAKYQNLYTESIIDESLLVNMTEEEVVSTLTAKWNTFTANIVDPMSKACLDIEPLARAVVQPGS